MKKLIRSFSILIILGGIMILLYPLFADYMSYQAQRKAITGYEKKIEKVDDNQIKRELKKSREYNENLVGKPVHDPFSKNQGYVLASDYNERLNIEGNGIMATLEIPSIDVILPIYHGCSEDVLKRGVGHIEGTSLPVGGKSSYCVLSGHRGLPEATLFTYLDKVKKGDEFYIKVLGETHAYKVFEIKTVLPDKLNSTRPQDDKDIVTLVTCTPYGVNTHRLLVSGYRVKYNPKIRKNEAVKAKFNSLNYYNYICGGIAIGFVIIFVAIIIYKRFKAR